MELATPIGPMDIEEAEGPVEGIPPPIFKEERPAVVALILEGDPRTESNALLLLLLLLGMYPFVVMEMELGGDLVGVLPLPLFPKVIPG